MENEKVIDKIKKLLELAASPVEAEAKLAYARAQELMAKYSLSVIDTESKPEDIIMQNYEIKIKKSTGLVDAVLRIAMAVGRNFGVYILMRSTSGVVHTIKLVGFKTNVLLVEYALDCILTQCAIDFREAYMKERSVSFAPNFWSACAEALEQRFTQNDTNSEAGLVVYDPVKKYMRQFSAGAFVNGSSANSTSGKAAGFEAGSKAAIRPGVNSPSEGRLLQ